MVQTASREIQSGEHIQLDWPLHNVQFPGFGRKEFSQTKIDLNRLLNFKAMDDELYINTQSGSQWDSLKHFAHQKTGKYYNGLTHEQAVSTDTNGIHNWCERGGIVGRGVLVDWLAFWQRSSMRRWSGRGLRRDREISCSSGAATYGGTSKSLHRRDMA
jgi:hypothetical protein